MVDNPFDDGYGEDYDPISDTNIDTSQATDDGQTSIDEISDRQKVQKIAIYGYNQDGSPQFQVFLGQGLPIVLDNAAKLDEWIGKQKDRGNWPAENEAAVTNSNLGNGSLSRGDDGSFSWSGTNNTTGETITSGRNGTSPAPGGGGGGGGSPGGGGGGAPRPSGGQQPGFQAPPGGGGGSVGTPGGVTSSLPGPSGIDPNAPLGGPSDISSTYNPQSGADYFGAGSQFAPSAGNPFAGLDENSSLFDVAGSITGGQLGARDAALGALGGAFNESLNSRESQGQRANINTLIENPYSFGESDIRRMQGRTTEAIGQRAARQRESGIAGDASAGIDPASGVARRRQTTIGANAARDATRAEADIRQRAAETNKGDLRSALSAAGGAIGQDQGARRDLARDIAGVNERTQFTGDAFLDAAALGSGQGLRNRVAEQPRYQGWAP